MQMDDMPIDWVEQVISFLPLTDVYKCKSVCMAWHVAADRVLSDWETLVIVVGAKEEKADDNHIFLLDDAETWIKRLKYLVGLKEIYVRIEIGGDFGPKLLPVVDDVVLRNASTLTLLHMRSEKLPFDPKRPVVFRNLRDLECKRMDADQAGDCPRLVKLRTSTSVKGLQKLPAETLTSLRIDGLDFETGSHVEIEQLVAALSRLTRLKSLILNRGFRDPWTELHDREFSKLFANMRELEEVDIAFLCAVNVDAVIETLVNHCPSVRSITMYDSEMTDNCLHCLSRLTGLQHLNFACWTRVGEITTEGILSLLRGGSRNVLQDVELSMLAWPDLYKIRAEGQLMQQETGRSLSVHSEDWPSGRLHEISIIIKG